MTKYANCVRFLVKPGREHALLSAFRGRDKYDGLEYQRLIQTGERSFLTFGEWESEEALAAARPTMIAFLDTLRDDLEEISPELGVTDPVSGPVVHEA